MISDFLSLFLTCGAALTATLILGAPGIAVFGRQLDRHPSWFYGLAAAFLVYALVIATVIAMVAQTLISGG